MGPRGFRRRGRRRGLIVGTAVGVSMAHHSQKKSDQAEPEPAAAAPASAPAADNTSQQFAQLEKLGQLKDQGVLTQSEFDAKKAQILGS